MPKKLTQEEFIDRCKIIFNKEDYDYSLVDYNTNNKKVIIICKYHGQFEIYPNAFLNGRKCPKCTKIGSFKTETEKFIYEAKFIHNKIHENYDYSLVDYKNSKTKVKIICKEHGIFEQIPEKHKSGQGCPKCNINGSYKRITTLKDIIHKFNKIHNNKYDYSLVDYKNSKTKVKIICKEHGIFEQLPNAHIVGKGCKLCHYEKINNIRVSKPELEILEFIKSNYDGEILNNTWKAIGDELDIYLPELKVAFEFNGLYWHNELHKDKNYHLNKTKKCELEGIRLIHIFEDSWIYKKSIVKSRILSVIGKTERIFGRKCIIKEIDINLERKFLNDNHLSGYINSEDKIALFYNDEIVALMTFGKCRFKQDKTELLRFVTKNNTTVIGAASKLFKYYIKKYNNTNIVTYADRAWGGGGFYTKLGFKFDSFTLPNYFYINRDKRENRFKYRKSELIKQGFSSKKTEKQIMLERKIYKIYDCGNLKFNYKI